MSIVSVSPKFQVVIPKAIREALDIHPGEKFTVMSYGERIEFIPARPLKALRGRFKGMDRSNPRDKSWT